MQLNFAFLGLLRGWLSLENQSYEKLPQCISPACKWETIKREISTGDTHLLLYMACVSEMPLVRQKKSCLAVLDLRPQLSYGVQKHCPALRLGCASQLHPEYLSGWDWDAHSLPTPCVTGPLCFGFHQKKNYSRSLSHYWKRHRTAGHIATLLSWSSNLALLFISFGLPSFFRDSLGLQFTWGHSAHVQSPLQGDFQVEKHQESL